MYIPKTLHEENVHNNYLMGLIFSSSWRVDPKKKKIPYGDLDFWNFVPKSIRSSVNETFANFYPGLVLHVLHWSHPGLVLHVLCQSLHPREPRSSRQRPPPPASPKRSAGCESEVKVKSEVMTKTFFDLP